LMYEDCYFAKAKSMVSAIFVLIHASVATLVTLTFHFDTAVGSASAAESHQFVISPGGHSRQAQIMRHVRRSSHSSPRTLGPLDEPGTAHQRLVRRAALVDVEGDIKTMSEDGEVQHLEAQDTTENGKPEHVEAGDAEEVQGGPNRTLFLQHASKAVGDETQSVPSCDTTKGERCTFPFVYGETRYDTCTDVHNGGKWWCATRTGAGNKHIEGEWGDCDSDCYDCAFGSWRSWTTCSKTCGSGMHTRTRAVVRAAIASGSCDMAQSSEKQPCTVTKCPTTTPTITATTKKKITKALSHRCCVCFSTVVPALVALLCLP